MRSRYRRVSRSVPQRRHREPARPASGLDFSRIPGPSRRAPPPHELREHNAEVDELERSFRAGTPRRWGVLRPGARAFRVSPRVSCEFQAAYRPDPRELVVEYRLPPKGVIPTIRDFRHVKARCETDELARPVKEIKELNASVINQVALRTMWECFFITAVGQIVDTVVFNGNVATSRATGQAEELDLISAPAWIVTVLVITP